MFIADFLAALAIALFVVWIFSFAFGAKGPWNSFLWFFLVVALFAWAGGIWLVPFGPRWYGIGWLPIFLMALLAAFLVSASSPRSSRQSAKNKKQTAADDERRSALDLVFWLLIIFLVIFGTSHYLWNPQVVR
ncbi:MAG TPA: hypothetical protein VN963_02065 [bacterium]|nr:hypothetical protein [bacterium]